MKNMPFLRRIVVGAMLLACTVALPLLVTSDSGALPFEVYSIFPADRSNGVPPDSTIEIEFTGAPQNIDQHFEIAPAVSGRFTYEGNKAIFLPSVRLQHNTSYTVTIKAGLRPRTGFSSLPEDVMFRFITAPDPATAGALELYATQTYETFLPIDSPVLDIRTNNTASGFQASFQVNTYQLNDAKQYLDILYAAAHAPADSEKERASDSRPLSANTNGLEKVVSFEQEVILTENYKPMSIIFPEPLPEGWYLIDAVSLGDASLAGSHVQKVIQVSSVAAYHQTANGEALLWLNSTTGETLAGSDVSVYVNPSDAAPESKHTLADDGTVIFDMPLLEHPELAENEYATDNRYYIMQTASGGQFAEVVADTRNRELDDDEKYYSYIYTDREIYRQSDTIKLWGVLRPRRDDAPPVTTAHVYLNQNWADTKTAEAEVTVLPDGTFSGEISYDALVSGYYSISLSLTAQPKDYWSGLYSKSVRISAYEKPVYTCETTTDKDYYFADELIDASFAVNFFDGTPAPGISLVAGEFAVDGAASLTTNFTGKVKAKFDPAPAIEKRNAEYPNMLYSWRPLSVNAGASSAGAEQQNFTTGHNVTVFPSKVMLRANLKENLTSNSVTIRANKIDFTKLLKGEPDNFWREDYQAIEGAPIELPITVKVMKRTWTKIAGTPYYSHYLKKSFPRWSYTFADSVHQEIEATTKNGMLQLDNLPKSRSMESYWVDIELTRPDSEGGVLRESVDLGKNYNWPSSSEQGQIDTKRHTFKVATSYESETNNYYGYYYDKYFNFNDNISFELLENNLPMEQQQGKVLYNLGQDAIIRHGVSNGISGNFVADEPTIPNFNLCGAYFDGTRIYPVVPYNLMLSSDSRSMRLSVTADKERYRPGDTAEVTLSLLSAQGQPVPGARVCLGVVDEAIFAIEPQEIRFTQDFFRSVYSYYPQIYATYRQRPDVYYDEGGKGGGGGDDTPPTVREKFKDTVDVYNSTTDGSGNARFSFTVPDNLTSWRLTALAISQDNYTAETKSNVFATLPFFVQPIMNSRYLEGDNISFTVRSFGSGARTGAEVRYTVDIKGANGHTELKQTTKIGEYATFAAGNLPSGSYTATIQAITSGYSDAVRHSFEVVTGALEVPITQTFSLADGISVEPLRYPVNIYLYNDDYKHYMRAVRVLQRDWYSNRADTAIANKAVRKSLEAFYGDDWNVPDTFNLESVQSSEGGVRLFPYAEPDLETTAKACVASNGSIDAESAKQYLRNHSTNSFAYLGLAALGEDSTQPIKEKLKLPNLPLKERLTLISALSYTDKPAAIALYQKDIVPLFSAKDMAITGKSTEKVLWLAGGSAYESIDLTSCAMMASLLTGAPDTEALLAYLYDGYRQSYWRCGRGPASLESALYINSFVPKNSEPTVVTYQLDGTTVTKPIEKESGFYLSVNKAQLAALNLRLQSGGGLAEVTYVGTPDETGYEQSKNITIEKSIEPVGDTALGGDVRVDITVALGAGAPGGCYTVTEWVPSNLRFKAGDGKHYASLDGQLMSYSLWLKAGETIKLSYTASLVLEAGSVAESTYVFHDSTMEGARTERTEFKPF